VKPGSENLHRVGLEAVGMSYRYLLRKILLPMAERLGEGKRSRRCQDVGTKISQFLLGD